VPTIFRFREIQNNPAIKVKPLKIQRLLSFYVQGRIVEANT